MENISDIKISGFGKFAGGTYRDISISGMGDINGDIKAETLSISGMGKIKGNADLQKMKVSGTATITGNVESKVIRDSGALTIDGNLKAGEMTVNGSFKVGGGIKAQLIDSSGFISSGEGLEAEEFRSRGGFKVNGLLNANNIDIKFGWNCYAREIGGEEIVIKHGKFMDFSLFLSLFGRKDRLVTEQIEGTNITLEYTVAKTVRGNKIIIGDKCEIDQVEYMDTLEIAPGAVVKSRIKL